MIVAHEADDRPGGASPSSVSSAKAGDNRVGSHLRRMRALASSRRDVAHHVRGQGGTGGVHLLPGVRRAGVAEVPAGKEDST